MILQQQQSHLVTRHFSAAYCRTTGVTLAKTLTEHRVGVLRLASIAGGGAVIVVSVVRQILSSASSRYAR